MQALQRKMPFSELRISRNSVPHIVVRIPKFRQAFSICFFGKSRIWRLFSGYCDFTKPQRKYTFKNHCDLLRFLEDKLNWKWQSYSLDVQQLPQI